MKNTILTMAVATVLVLASACNKEKDGDHICTCRDTDGNIESTTPFRNVTLSEARDGCSTIEDNLNDQLFNPNVYICRID